MPVKEPEWALNELREYLRLHERIPLPLEDVTPNAKTRARGSKDQREAQSLVVRHIWEAIFGNWPRYVDESSARRCIFEIERGAEMRAKLEPGDAPVLDASELHPWVWEAARPHWVSGNHDAALWAAGINVNSRLQTKVGRKDLGETKLLQECFSLEPPKPGRPRLRLCGDENPDLFKDRHVGAMQVGGGLYAAVRNPLNHVVPDDNPLTEREALECLAGFSLLARWIERAEMVTVDLE
jgi:hypothetical protein